MNEPITYMNTILQNVKELEQDVKELEDKIIQNKKATQEELDLLQDEFKIKIMQVAEKLRDL